MNTQSTRVQKICNLSFVETYIFIVYFNHYVSPNCYVAEKLTSHILTFKKSLHYWRGSSVFCGTQGCKIKSVSLSITPVIHARYLKVIIVPFMSVFETNNFWPLPLLIPIFLNLLSSFHVESVIRHGFCIMHPFCVHCSTKKWITATECSSRNAAVIRKRVSKVFKFIFNRCHVLSYKLSFIDKFLICRLLAWVIRVPLNWHIL